MRTNRYSFTSTPSQKSITYSATEDSQGDISTGYYLPSQNQKRFTRKNNNTSIEKKKSKSNLFQTEPDCSVIAKNCQETPRLSKEKSIPIYIKSKPEIRGPRLNQTHRELGSNGKSGSFKVLKNVIGKRNHLDDTIRISQQKPLSRYSGNSIDSKGGGYGKENNISVLKTQLELKEKELMAIEDERRRFRNNIQEMKRKQTCLQQQIKKSQEQFKQMEQKLRQNISSLQEKVKQIGEFANQVGKQNQKLKKDLETSAKEKKIIEKQLKVFIDKQVPKNIRQLQSCRQIFLQKSVQQLKKQLNRNKTQVEKQMQIVIQKLRIQNVNLKTQIKNYEIIKRMLQKKAGDAKRYLQAYTTVKSEYKETKQQLKQLRQECQFLRKQNVRIKKQIKELKKCNKNSLKGRQKMYTEGSVNEGPAVKEYIGEKVLLRVPSQAQSLILSISQFNG